MPEAWINPYWAWGPALFFARGIVNLLTHFLYVFTHATHGIARAYAQHHHDKNNK
jgi:hypothetical protein